MTFIKQSVGLLRSVRRWGVPGLLLALAVTWGSGEVAAATRTINLNTGYDQWSIPPNAIALGEQDNEWRVTSPLLNGGVPIAAYVVNDTQWGSISTQFPNSRWISINLTAASLTPVPTSYDYIFYFTLPPGFSSPNLTMKLSSDDDITKVTLNSSSCVLFPGPPGGIFTGNPLSLSSAAPPLPLSCFKSGSQVNVITVTVQDKIAGFTGLVVDGAVTYEDCDRRPVASIPNVSSITFLEGSGGPPTSIVIPINDQRLKDRIATGSLGSGLRDFEGVPAEEFYDVFFSNWDGTVNPSGQFVTIEALWDRKLPAGGGLNIGAVQLDFSGGPPLLADFVSSFVALGDNAIPLNVGNAVDTSPATFTAMGNTVGQTRQRLRVTVGFPRLCGLDPCCPPWNSTRLENMLEYHGSSGGIAAPYTLSFTPASTPANPAADLFKNQIQAYIDYLHLVNSSINEIIIQFWLEDGGSGATTANGSHTSPNNYFIGWFNGANGVPHGDTNFFSIISDPMQVNNWYRVNTYVYLNNNNTFFPASCAFNFLDIRLDVLPSVAPQSGAASNRGTLQMRLPNGETLTKSVQSSQ